MDDKLIQSFIETWGQTVLLWQRLARPRLERAHLTQTDKRILYGLYGVKEITKKELAQRVVLEHSSLTRSLDRLEERGLITRVTQKEDKRYVKLSLTQQGRSTIRSVKRESFKLAQDLLSGATEKNIKQSIEVLEKFKNAMKEVI